MIEKTLTAIESAIAAVSRYTLGKDFTTYCDLRTVIGLTEEDKMLHTALQAPTIFVTHTGDYASVFEIQGAFCEFDEQAALSEAEKKEDAYAFHYYIARLHTALASEFKTLGHKLSVVFERDPEHYRLEGLKIRHDALVSKIEQDFSTDGQGVLLRLMNAHEVGFTIREEIDRTGTARHWQPLLPGDPIFPHGMPKGKDHSGLLLPHLNYQLFSQEANTYGNLVELDGLWHSSLAVTLGPQKPETFTQLFNKINRKVPFRVRFDLMPGGHAILGKKRTALDFLAVIPSLRPVYSWAT